MAKFEIKHVTQYRYEVPVRDSANQIMLFPITDEHQEVESQSLSVTGDPVIEMHTDAFGNKVGTFTHSQPHSELIIDSRLEVLTRAKALPDDNVAVDEQWDALDKLMFQIPFIDFLRISPIEALPEILEVTRAIRSGDGSPLTVAKNFSTYVYENFSYQKGITTVETTLDEIWKIKTGVCQDFAHILLAFLRQVRIPARYVSGYICPNKNEMRGEGATHAWVEAYIPFYGWLGLDPTNNCIANENHVRLAVGKNFTDCSPVRGTYRGTSKHTLEVAVTVSYEDGHSFSDSSGECGPMEGSGTNSFRRHQEIQQQQ